MITSIMCLALNMYFEATPHDIDDRIAVSMVVLKRADSIANGWPSNVCDVISQPSNNTDRPKACQFSWTCDDKADIVKTEDLRIFGEMLELAESDAKPQRVVQLNLQFFPLSEDFRDMEEES